MKIKKLKGLKILFFSILLSCAVVVQTARAHSQASPTPKKNSDQSESASIVVASDRGSCANPLPNDLSFLITADQAQLNQLPNGEFLLTMEGVGPYITFYTRRPCYTSGLAPTANFVRAWHVGSDSFSNDSPTGILTAAVVDGILNKNTLTRILRFSHPSYDFENSSMRFVVSPVGQNNPIIIKSTRYRNVALLIN